MPLIDAARPSRKQILAAQRKKYGAYIPERLQEELPTRRTKRLDRRWRKAYHPSSTLGGKSLKKRDIPSPGNDDSDTAVDTSNTASLPSAPAEPPVPSNIPSIDYGNAKNNHEPTPPVESHDAVPAATPVDTNAATLNATTLSTSSSDTSPIGAAKQNTRRTVGIVVGVLFAVATLLALGFFFKRYRQKLSPTSSKTRFSKKQHRLTSFDGLKASSRESDQTTPDDKANSKETFLKQAATERAGPFDCAISTMFCTSPTTLGQRPRPQPPTPTPTSAGSVRSKPALRLKQSLDSIAEVQEPKSGASTHFGRNSISSFKQRHLNLERPQTSPAKVIVSSPPSAFKPFEELSGRRVSPGRPQSAKGSPGEIEMTRRGSQLVIRRRSSNGGLRRPLSSAGNGLRSALRKTGLGGGEGDEGGPICIETDGIVESDIHTKRNSTLSVCGIQDSPLAGKGRELRSHFSCSTLNTDALRASYAATVSPSGSFSFEIRDAVRKQIPVKGVSPDTSASDPETKGELRVQEAENRLAKVSADSFLRDLDWDLTDCRLAEDWPPKPTKS